MAKLIRSTKECKYKHNGHSFRYNNYCFHADGDGILCIPKGEQNFPDNCPLEDGVPMPLTIQDLMDIDEVMKDTDIPIECLQCDESDVKVCRDCKVIKDSYQG